jgi:SAM-dependent methyltransferase
MATTSPLRVLYQAQQFPIFQNRMYETAVEAVDCPKGNISLVEDLTTGLIYNQAFQPDLMQYDRHYQNEQAVSGLFRDHLETVIGIIQRTMGHQSIIEIGCGKGFFLEMLVANGYKATGFDPTYEGANPDIVKQYFMPGLGIQAPGLVLRHVLEHIQDPVEFLEKIRDANGGGGKIYIEVPCFDWICEHRAWFDIFYEHVNYFRLIDFRRMFGTVYETGCVFNRQYLYIVADLATLKVPEYHQADRIKFPENFLDSVKRYATKLAISDHRSAIKSVVWGGASKGVIFALLMARAGAKVDMVIDINPAKQGKFLAATGLQVWSPESALPKLAAGANIFVMNSNYLDEIREVTANQFNYLLVDQ